MPRLLQVVQAHNFQSACLELPKAVWGSWWFPRYSKIVRYRPDFHTGLILFRIYSKSKFFHKIKLPRWRGPENRPIWKADKAERLPRFPSQSRWTISRHGSLQELPRIRENHLPRCRIQNRKRQGNAPQLKRPAAENDSDFHAEIGQQLQEILRKVDNECTERISGGPTCNSKGRKWITFEIKQEKKSKVMNLWNELKYAFNNIFKI